MARTPARRTGSVPAPPERVEIRLIARDGLAQHLAEQISAAIPGCPPPRYYPSRKTAGQTLAYMSFNTPPGPPALNT